MKAFLQAVLILVGCVSLDPVIAQSAKAPSEGRSVVDRIKQLEREWADAIIAADIDRLSQIIADDFMDGYPGKVRTKADFLSAIKSGKIKLESCEFDTLDVKVLGSVAVVQGTVSEITIKDGQRSTVRVAFMDVFVKRGDKWVVVRAQVHKI